MDGYDFVAETPSKGVWTTGETHLLLSSLICWQHLLLQPIEEFRLETLSRKDIEWRAIDSCVRHAAHCCNCLTFLQTGHYTNAFLSIFSQNFLWFLIHCYTRLVHIENILHWNFTLTVFSKFFFRQRLRTFLFSCSYPGIVTWLLFSYYNRLESEHV